MRRLALLRHAKSAWDDPTLPDHDRPLNLRGRLAATLMGAWFAEQPWRLDAALVSSSRRTQETWARVSQQLDAPPEQIVAPEIYEAETIALLRALRTAPADAETVLMLGHNPGMEEFAARLGAPASPRPGAFPTATVAVFTTEAAWAQADWGRFALVDVERPKTLV